MIYFFDSSGIAKLYIEETGSEWVQEIFDTTPIQYLWISRIAGPEVTSALTRRFRSGDLSDESYHDCLDEFKYNYEWSFSKIDVTHEVIKYAMELIERHNLRGYDGVQLSSAILVNNSAQRQLKQTITFISADNKLCTCAQDEGLIVENPNNYP
ncbi:MAG: type II toxin-antitoxin system VapC family toxin [Methanosarcinales archaeon]